MIELILLRYLEKKLSPVPVLMEYPEENIRKFAVMEKTGSGESNGIQSAQIAIQSHGKNLMEAAELNEEVKDAMESLIEEDVICDVQRNTDYNFTDDSTGHYRYQAIFDIKFIN
ncbi:hypothetical protein [Hornefia butyriciproducens]|uniref:hypothetical protein n=1 Tax=Hornefia butyriciproducens TaxID=2652293 RepID=UPI002A91437A|nr:hypothetical protein [Hornefia butyriciproducens]MDY6211989.1 hypothetical protein [Hornefia butyriciproducens]